MKNTTHIGNSSRLNDIGVDDAEAVAALRHDDLGQIEVPAHSTTQTRMKPIETS